MALGCWDVLFRAGPQSTGGAHPQPRNPDIPCRPDVPGEQSVRTEVALVSPWESFTFS